MGSATLPHLSFSFSETLSHSSSVLISDFVPPRSFNCPLSSTTSTSLLPGTVSPVSITVSASVPLSSSRSCTCRFFSSSTACCCLSSATNQLIAHHRPPHKSDRMK